MLGCRIRSSAARVLSAFFLIRGFFVLARASFTYRIAASIVMQSSGDSLTIFHSSGPVRVSDRAPSDLSCQCLSVRTRSNLMLGPSMTSMPCGGLRHGFEPQCRIQLPNFIHTCVDFSPTLSASTLLGVIWLIVQNDVNVTSAGVKIRPDKEAARFVPTLKSQSSSRRLYLHEISDNVDGGFLGDCSGLRAQRLDWDQKSYGSEKK